jgi:hypothetical protein
MCPADGGVAGSMIRESVAVNGCDRYRSGEMAGALAATRPPNGRWTQRRWIEKKLGEQEI